MTVENEERRSKLSKTDSDLSDKPLRTPGSGGGFSTATPISFDRSTFSGATFSPEDFLADRRHIALDQLKTELQQALRDLKAELVELINLDYADFINLSTKLVGVDKIIADISQPLEKINTEVQSVYDALSTVINELETELDKRASIREKKGYLQLFVSIHDSIGKLDALLNVAEGNKYVSDFEGDNGSTEKSFGDGKLIERVANEYTQLRYLISRADNKPFVQQIQKRITRIKDTLTSSLSRSLTTSYSAVMKNGENPSTHAALSQILRTYVTIDKVDEAQNIFKETVMRPFLDKNISRQALGVDSIATSPVTDKNPLQDMYSKILEFTRKDCAKVLEVTTRAFHGTNGNLLIHGIWAPVITTILKNISFIFNPGIPEVFHRNYATTMRFVTEFECLCKTRKSLSILRSHQSTGEFMRRWQLPVYFQIRFREIATDFEETALASYNYDGNFTANDGLILPPSTALIVCMQLCWDDSVYLCGLSHRFWKLTLQLLARYTLWVRQALQPDIDVSAISSDSQDAEQKGSSPPTTVRTGSSSGKGGPTSTDASSDAALRKFLYFYNDIRGIEDQVHKFFDDSIKSKLPAAVRDDSILRESLDASLSPLKAILPQLSQRVCKVLIRRCSDPLRNNIHSITPQYRMTNKEPPSRPSHFITTIFKPLSSFFDDHRHLLKATTIPEWTSFVMDDVTGKYAKTMGDVLSHVKGFEEYNRKKNLKKSSALPGTLGGEEGMSDDDKIRLQMYLDVDQYEKQLIALGINPRELSSFRELSDLVAPYKNLVGSRR
ncbi:uncharacterized protein SPPG_05552 [Spizellomyces punctatus DAOM BR117]|uniref:Conserved oligomeric Golgi complex subunit 2 n=1 Tax=Spizellomyces punctatus (strain DAOM BR117) TaxID=645134 RepID=A0A0L0HEV5_SPIPD|nr:uncharacterized protein SPPG_05552 [Spizellomyces punctatus DAOM BR117]KNC99298.1 hypothetical protein SPPG_05552 [Spizellomyces punctatus DAOM BR117]|eukprot:XP_016607338.1 hypothetical protein SPPG_05552 [Spizellomyces punctatus DAOM BR117]